MPISKELFQEKQGAIIASVSPRYRASTTLMA